MLRTRIITAIVIAPLVVAAVYLLPLQWFAVFFWIVASLCAYEWAGLLGFERVTERLLYICALGALVAITWVYRESFKIGLWIGVATWLVAMASVLAYPRSTPLFKNRWVNGGIGLIVPWAAWLALVVIRSQPSGHNWLLWLLLLVWAADVGAYFAGHAFGRLKLARTLSPGKTWEGFAGGMALSLAVCGVSLLAFGFSPWWLLTIVGLVGISVVGDLFESALKRVRGVKDSGNLLPGHGGFLDRVDSVLAVLPVFALIVTRGD